MPNKKKKPSKNGFWQFVLECRDKTPGKNMEEAKNYAARKWANMSKEEKKPYEEKAALARDTFRPVRLTSDGYEIDEVEREQQEAEKRVQQMRAEIIRNFKTARLAEKLADHVFILIHINHLVYYNIEDRYLICELALAAVSLKNGIEDIFHRIVKPGQIPLGYKGSAVSHSKSTHQLFDIVQEDSYEDNSQETFNEMIEFMKRYRDPKLPILYADEKTHEMTVKVMETFRQQFQFPEEIKVYNMQFMFMALKNAAAGENVWPSETFSYNEIEKDFYCYSPGIGCEFHEMADVTTYCSKSIVTRYAYTICDNCCGDLDIPLVPGFHVPTKAKLTNDLSKSSSMLSIDQMCNDKGRMSSASSARGYEENYPPLCGSPSSASSVISFSSMKTPKNRNNALTASNVAALERSFQNASLNSLPKRDHKSMKFPPRAFLSQSEKNE